MVTLAQAREAVLAWAAARRAGRPVRLPEAWHRDLEWLGLDVDGDGPPPKVPGGPLTGAEGWTLDRLRREGYVPEGVLSYLGELGWPESHAWLTRPELILEYREEELSPDPVAFDGERLDEVNGQFLEELTPAELLERSLPFWPELQPTEEQRLDLEALALLYASEVRRLSDFPRLVGFYVDDPPARPLPELAAALATVDPWDAALLEEALRDVEDPEAVEIALTGATGAPDLAAVMALVGREATLRRLRG